ncbi:MAG: response regulator transcription factor [Bacteroidetes bacterium]|nr:MAG: response regulator transcription factor [Bacteroidota bacterium]
MINIAFAEDQVLFRKGMISLLKTFEDIKVCIEAENGEDLLTKMSEAKEPVHVALIDINMPVMNGIETLKQMRLLHPAVKNIILTVHEEDKFIHKLIEEGANAYLAKNADPEEVKRAIQAVTTHDYYFNEKTIGVMRNFNSGKKQKGTLQNVEDITSREKEVLLYICREFTSPEIAEKLFITESTVNGHRNNLLAKTGARNTAGLVLFAIKNNLFDIDFR